MARLPHLAAAIILAAGLFAAQPASAACCHCSSIDVVVYTFAGGGSSCTFEGTECECLQGESQVTCQENCIRSVNLGDLSCTQGGWGNGATRTKWSCSGDTQCSKSCGYGATISVCADGAHTYVPEGGSCPSVDPCSPNPCRLGQACTSPGGTASCACLRTEHRHDGLSCHRPATTHSCPAGQHKPAGVHSPSNCHGDHVCKGDQTGGGAADCVDPTCVGDQTLSAAKVCVDPTCVGDQTLSAGKCVDPTCVGDQTLTAAKVCQDPACVDGTVSAGVCSCPTGASLEGGECKCGDDSRPPCTPADPCSPNPCRLGQACTSPGGTASCACLRTEHRHDGLSCHRPATTHSCPAGQHKPAGVHSPSACHGNHVCKGDQTGGGAADCVDPTCVGDQTLSAAKVCVDPTCVGDQTLSAGKCVDPTCVGDQTLSAGKCVDPTCVGDQRLSAGKCVDPTCVGDQRLSAGKVCEDPTCVDGTVAAGVCTCPTGASLEGGECKCGDDSRPPCAACPGTEHSHDGLSCHGPATTHSCPPGQHKLAGDHSPSACHGNHVCTGDQTGGGTADCVDPTCVGDQRLSAGKVCEDPTCVGDQTLSAGKVCEDPTCVGDQTLSAGKVCEDPTCVGDQRLSAGKVCEDPTCVGDQTLTAAKVCQDPACVDGTVSAGVCSCPHAATLEGGECKCGDDSRPPCAACPPGQVQIFNGQCRDACGTGSTAVLGVCECDDGLHHHHLSSCHGHSCPPGRVSSGSILGHGCVACADGTRPAASGTACEPCPTGTAGTGGACEACPTGTVPNEGRTACVVPPPPMCTGGAIVQGTCVCHDTARVVVSGVCVCAAGSHEVALACVPCPADGVSVAGEACTRCGPERVPNAAATECVACPAGQRESDAQGVCECTSGDMVVSPVDPSRCLLCIQGTRAVRGECVCPDRDDDPQHRHEGGWCHRTTTPHACPERCPGRTVCAPSGQCVCPPGWLDVLGRHRCLRAKCQSPDEAGTYPRCVECPPGEVADAPRTACVACPPGQVELPASPGACTACAPGQAPSSSATECEPCPPDTRARTGDAVCFACGAGQVPNAARTACEPCPRGAAETTPGECVACGDGRTPAASRVACSACSLDHAGTGGECVACTAGRVPTADRTACVACPDGHRERIAGACEACPDGETPAADATTCAGCGTDTAGTGGQCGRCGDGEVPDRARTACRVCPPGNAELPSSPGVCTACPDGQVPNATDTACVACPDGQSPDAVDLDACGDCGTDTAGTGGKCEACPDGVVPTADRTACVDCARNAAETTPGKCEVCPVGSCSDTTQTVHSVCIDGGGTWTVAQAPDLARTSCLSPGVLDLLSPELALAYLLAIKTALSQTLTVVQAVDEVFAVLDEEANAELDRITGKLGGVETLLTGGNALLGSLADVVSPGSCSVGTHTTRGACEAASGTWTRGGLDVGDAELARILGDVEDLLAGTGADNKGLSDLHQAVLDLRDGLDGCVAGGATTCTDTDLGDIDASIEALKASTLSWGTDSDITRAGVTGSHWLVRARAADNACRCWGIAINYCGEARAGPYVRSYVYDGRTFDAAGAVLIRNSRCHSIECTDVAASAVRDATGCTSEDVDWVYSDAGSGDVAVETAVDGLETAVDDLETVVGDLETAVGDLETAITDASDDLENAGAGSEAEQAAAQVVITAAQGGNRALVTSAATVVTTLPRKAGSSNDVGDLTAGVLSGIATWRARSAAATCPAFGIDFSGVSLAPGTTLGNISTTHHCPTAGTVTLIRALFGFLWLVAVARVVLSA